MGTSAPTSRAHARFDPAAVERELGARCAHLVAAAKVRGADEAEVFGSRSRTIAVRFEKGDLKLAQVDEGSTLGLRIFHEKRLGFSSTNQADERALQHCAEEALALARFAPPDEHNRLPVARALALQAPLVDPALAALSVEEVVEFGRRVVERVAARDARLSIDAASVDLSRSTHSIWTTTGVHAAESDCLFSCSIGALAVDGQDVGGMHYEGDVVRTRGELERSLEHVADTVASTALGNLAAARGESYAGSVLFAPDAFFDVFLAPLVSAASAIAVQRGRSPLAGKLGSAVASALLEIVDDPTDRTLAGCGSFDREGQPAAVFPFVVRGELAGYFYNGYAAAVEGRTSTGHASGGARGVPGLGPHALCVRGGDGGTREQMVAALGRGLFVQRFSGTVDAASGDFSGVAKASRWVEGGKIVRPVREMLLSGNVYKLLHQLQRLSSVEERLGGGARAPYALVDGLSVTAG
ncbi:MAG: TldD/PmbA family protein [Planctomycetes bacterium]|nr:TldD/PmbA family protein [Planctomycetota bacterium]